MTKKQACKLFNYLHVFRCLVRVKWAKLDLTSISALQLGQITALLIVFVGTGFPFVIGSSLQVLLYLSSPFFPAPFPL